MKVQPAAYLRTTLPLDISQLKTLDSGRYHSIWLPNHMVSIWPDSIWSPEFTDLATVSESSHRHLDAMAVAAAQRVAQMWARFNEFGSATSPRYPHACVPAAAHDATAVGSALSDVGAMTCTGSGIVGTASSANAAGTEADPPPPPDPMRRST